MPEQKAVAIEWNKLVLEGIKLTRTSPPLAARALAMAHTAMYDAWTVYDKNAISTTTAKYIKRFDDCEEGDMPAAISYAAFRVCTQLFWLPLSPENRSMFRRLMKENNYDPDDHSLDIKSPAGIGNLIAKLVIDYRRGDGANQEGILYHAAPWFDYSGYKSLNPPIPQQLKNINYWQPLIGADGKPQDFLTVHWPMVRPFALKSASQFRPPPPYNDDDHPREFRKQTEEIFEISQSLTELQKAIAEYWADGVGTVTPPGHWCEIAQYVADRHCEEYSESDYIKLFFALANALLDSSIACWDAKRRYESARPISVIREMMNKKNWKSYIPTPPFPEHVSGHSTFSRASAIILRNFTGSDEFGAAGVIEKGTSIIEPGKPLNDIQLPAWKTFSDAATEAGISRLFGGIHFAKGNEEGQKLGEAVGNRVWDKVKYYFNQK
ncbi:MAG TPA: hypothetical protein VEV87_09270 [Chitinophagaceae bacterium]|nr:hypothetical protein [Chitinophagaceae bacterium]